MTESTEENQAPEQEKEQERIVKTVTFHGRKIRVQTPSPAQVMVWKRILNQISEAGESISADRAISMLNRGRNVVDTILVNDEDKEWLDDQMLAGKMGFEELGDLMVKAVKLLSKDQGKGQNQGSARRKKPKGRS